GPGMAVKHLIVLKFKDEITEAQKEEFIKTYVNLVNIIPAMKDVYWGKDVTQKNKEEGYTHIVEVTFESVETIQDYIIHPAHVGFGDVYRSFWEKLLIFDYTPRK
uniref:Olivetolic acid cyclase n=1 Tax=Cannabis sativa TaxID=3483 RepID=UPI001EAE8400|nr:Chain A, Olivetolic acid cyclase [Cannabis sativa]7W6D_B Chain B, Olivetolic acid cyclase [Cannabis sativa]7W6E_A Chain A, Olivetolic acid cyclase [Cannabis sativa]7W6E_B Chain B, Olivetolic acid cyclase [Cannabis sativa]7W6F_A Chain A, Olivetolic acid cyclase [Cannabis sativa]7W6F_B Chain B, Olivetolic acid cyclase [Cannabis sativa]